MSANARLVMVLSALVLIAAGVRLALGPIVDAAGKPSLYAMAKAAPPSGFPGIDVQLAGGLGPSTR